MSGLGSFAYKIVFVAGKVPSTVQGEEVTSPAPHRPGTPLARTRFSTQAEIPTVAASDSGDDHNSTYCISWINQASKESLERG